jgi:hypothetical protein
MIAVQFLLPLFPFSHIDFNDVSSKSLRENLSHLFSFLLLLLILILTLAKHDNKFLILVNEELII